MQDQNAASELRTASGADGTPERALMCAVLEDAIRCLRGRGYPPTERAKLAIDAYSWIRDLDRRWLFSFENLCMALGFDAQILRSRLLDADLRLPSMSVKRRRPRRAPPFDSEIARADVGMVQSGQPLRVVAQTLGLSMSAASEISGRLASRLKAQRDAEIRQLRSAGWTCGDLAVRFGLSRVRVIRICARCDEDDVLAVPSSLGQEPGRQDGFPAREAP